MAPLWQAWPIHRTADVYATSRHGAARDFRRSRQDKSRKVRSVGTPAISIAQQTLRVSGATCYVWQCTAVAKLSTPCGGQYDQQRLFPRPSRLLRFDTGANALARSKP